MPFTDGARYESLGLGLAVICLSFIGTRDVFEIGDKTFRGHRRRFGRGRPFFFLALESVEDVGATVDSTGDGDACYLTLVLRDGANSMSEISGRTRGCR